MVQWDPEMELAEASARARAGDHAAFDWIVRRFWGRVLGYLWKRVREGVAEDLAQEVFARLYRVLRKGEGPVNDDTVAWERYLFTSARNILTDHFRSLGLRAPMTPLDDLEEDEEPEAEMSAHPADSLVTLEESRAIKDCMDQLEPSARAICWSYFVDGRSKRDIARSLDMPESTLRFQLASALRVLRACLEGKGILGGE